MPHSRLLHHHCHHHHQGLDWVVACDCLFGFWRCLTAGWNYRSWQTQRPKVDWLSHHCLDNHDKDYSHHYKWWWLMMAITSLIISIVIIKIVLLGRVGGNKRLAPIRPPWRPFWPQIIWSSSASSHRHDNHHRHQWRLQGAARACIEWTTILEFKGGRNPPRKCVVLVRISSTLYLLA